VKTLLQLKISASLLNTTSMIRHSFKALIRISILSFIFFLLHPATGAGQINFPDPAENPYWIEWHFWKPSDNIIDDDIVVSYGADVTIGNKTYHKLFCSGVRLTVNLSGTWPTQYYSTINNDLYAIIRHDTSDSKVYLLKDTTEYLLYDFKSLETGAYYPKTYNNLYEDSLVVISTDSLVLNNRTHRVWNLANRYNGIYNDSAFVRIIEGIGSSFGVVGKFRWDKNESGDFLNCFNSDSTGIYPDSLLVCDRTFGVEEYKRFNKIRVFPNPAARYLTIQAENISHRIEVSLFDLSGRLLISNSLTSQIYCFDINHLEDGLYILVFRSEGQLLETQKLIIRR